MKHKNTQPLYIFNRENPKTSEPQNGPRSGLDYIALPTIQPQQTLEAAASGLAPPKNNRGALGDIQFFDQLLTSTLLTLSVDQNKHFWTTYPLLPFHVVIERPLIC